MILGIGVDMAEIVRFVGKDKDRDFLERIYTKNEIDYILKKVNREASLASHFASKEAILKAVGTGMGFGLSTKDAQVLHDEKGKPYFKLSDRLENYFNEKKIISHLSISHEKHYAIAFVILECM